MAAVAERTGQGFADPTFDSQSTFRAILDAFASPGRVVRLDASCGAPAGLPVAAALTLLTLADYETPIWLPDGFQGDARRWLTFHTGAAMVADTKSAKFAVIGGNDDKPRLCDFDQGEDRYPDRSATIIVLCRTLAEGPPVVLRGPGILGEACVAPLGLQPDFWADWADNTSRFPLGVDAIFVAGRDLMAIPRSIHAQPVTGGA